MSRRMAGMLFLLPCALAHAQPAQEQAREAERRYKAGIELMRSESWEEAGTEFKAATAADPNMVLAHYNLGQCRMPQKRFVEAASAYKNAKEAFLRLSQLGERELAARDRDRQEEIRGLRDNLQQLHTVKDGSAEKRQMEIEARIQLLESLRFKGNGRPNMPAEFPLALGSAYFRQEMLDEAKAEYEEAIRLNPKLGPAHNNLAVIHFLTGHLAEADAELQLAKKGGFPINPQLAADIQKAKASK